MLLLPLTAAVNGQDFTVLYQSFSHHIPKMQPAPSLLPLNPILPRQHSYSINSYFHNPQFCCSFPSLGWTNPFAPNHGLQLSLKRCNNNETNKRDGGAEGCCCHMLANLEFFDYCSNPTKTLKKNLILIMSKLNGSFMLS